MHIPVIHSPTATKKTQDLSIKQSDHLSKLFAFVKGPAFPYRCFQFHCPAQEKVEHGSMLETVLGHQTPGTDNAAF